MLRARDWVLALPVTDDDRARVARCDDVATLERWLDLAITATRASELFDG